MSFMLKLEAFLNGCFSPAAAYAPATTKSAMGDALSFKTGEQAAMYRQHGDGALYREVQSSCLDLIRNDEFNLGRFQDGYRTHTGALYPLDIDVQSDDIFGLAVMLYDKERVRFSRHHDGAAYTFIKS